MVYCAFLKHNPRREKRGVDYSRMHNKCHWLTHLNDGSVIFGNNSDLYPIHLVCCFIENILNGILVFC